MTDVLLLSSKGIAEDYVSLNKKLNDDDVQAVAIEGAPMVMLTIKSKTEDPKRALEIVEDRRNRGYDSWLEDESGKIVDERTLTDNKFEPTKSMLRERAMGLLFLFTTVVVGFGILYGVGLLVDR